MTGARRVIGCRGVVDYCALARAVLIISRRGAIKTNRGLVGPVPVLYAGNVSSVVCRLIGVRNDGTHTRQIRRRTAIRDFVARPPPRRPVTAVPDRARRVRRARTRPVILLCWISDRTTRPTTAAAAAAHRRNLRTEAESPTMTKVTREP